MAKRIQHIAIAACSFEVRADGAIQLTPAGQFSAKDGRPAGLPGWKTDDAIAQRVLARLKAKQSRLVIDYEHQTLHAEHNGKPAPAAGWFDGWDVEWRPGQGFFVEPKWTAAAKAHIEAGEYRYISPVMVYDRNTGEVLDIRMAALTNDPAIDGMRELEVLAAAKFSPTPDQEPPMDELLELLGLKPGSDEAEAVTALKAVLQKKTELEDQLKESREAVAALKAKGGEVDLSQYAPVSVVTDLQKQVAALKGQIDGNELEDLIQQGIDDGKIIGEEMEKWARSLEVAALKNYLDNTQAIAALKGSQTRGKGPGSSGGDGELSETDLAVCKQMGVDPEDYKKSLQEE